MFVYIVTKVLSSARYRLLRPNTATENDQADLFSSFIHSSTTFIRIKSTIANFTLNWKFSRNHEDFASPSFHGKVGLPARLHTPRAEVSRQECEPQTYIRCRLHHTWISIFEAPHHVLVFTWVCCKFCPFRKYQSCHTMIFQLGRSTKSYKRPWIISTNIVNPKLCEVSGPLHLAYSRDYTAAAAAEGTHILFLFVLQCTKKWKIGNVCPVHPFALFITFKFLQVVETNQLWCV